MSREQDIEALGTIDDGWDESTLLELGKTLSRPGGEAERGRDSC